MHRRAALPFGAANVPGGVRFRLWAPRVRSVALQLADEVLPMVHEPEGWFALTTDRALPGTRYRYVVDGTAIPTLRRADSPMEWGLGDGSRPRLIASFGAEATAAQDIGQDGRLLYASAETSGASRSAACILLPQ
jgi:hypothetical protein